MAKRLSVQEVTCGDAEIRASIARTSVPAPQAQTFDQAEYIQNMIGKSRVVNQGEVLERLSWGR